MNINSLQIQYVGIDSLKENGSSARRHSKVKIGKLADSIRRLGFNVPVLVDRSNTILSGHARVAAARLAGFDEIPVVRIEHLTELEAKAFMLADNRFALEATWDQEVLASSFSELTEIDLDLSITGFSIAEADLVISAVEDSTPNPRASDARLNRIPEPPEQPVSQSGDLWVLGRHKLFCGDAREAADYKLLLKDETAHLIFTDPPYNCRIAGNVSGLGKIQHADFAMASGEMSDEDFSSFLKLTLGLAAEQCADGAIAFVCMDWRGMGSLLLAGKEAFTELKNLCVWNKSNAGMGTFYRSKHELVFVFKKGTAPHTNNFGLGETGRYRTNVWAYPGMSSMSATRAEELASHPTCKPVALVADALLDCSRRGEIVLDPFGGSGTTLIAAQKTGRSARLIEYEPRYCDVIINRFQGMTGKAAYLSACGKSFEDVAEERNAGNAGEEA